MDLRGTSPNVYSALISTKTGATVFLAEHTAMRIKTKPPCSHVQACDQALANKLSAKVVRVISRKYVLKRRDSLVFFPVPGIWSEWNMVMMAGATAAILDHKVDATAQDELGHPSPR